MNSQNAGEIDAIRNYVIRDVLPRDNLSSSGSSDYSERNGSTDSDSLSVSHSDDSDDEDQEAGVGLRLQVIRNPFQHDILFPFMEHLLYGRPRPKVENYLNLVHQKSNEDFRKTFRLRRRLAYTLIDRLNASGYIPVHDHGKTKKSAEISFLMFLWYIGNEEPLRILGEFFDMSESSVFRIIRRVVDWLMTIFQENVQWPRGNAVQSVINGFAQARGVRNCIGAVDGCHVPIIKPAVPNCLEYRNYKKFYSVNLTAIVDPRKKFTMVYCGDPGSFHDTRVFRRSGFCALALDRPEELFPPGTFLLGDGGYQGISNDWLVHPFRDLGALTPNQREFNRIVSSTRVFVEQAFGILKGRFRRLLNQIHLFDLPFVVDLIIACCILHNMCLDDGDGGDEYFDPNWNVNEPDNPPQGEEVRPPASARERLFRELFPDAEYPERQDR